MKQQVSSDTKHNRTLGWGLDLSNPEVTTQEEIDEFRRVSAQQLGMQQPGLDFWLDTAPEVLKRYRLWADKLRVVEDDEAPNKWSATGVMIHYLYAMTNFQEGLHYGLLGMSRGLTKAQILEEYALVFRYVGPRGMAAIAEAARGHTWPEPTAPVKWPKGWGPDPDAFTSGADFRSPGVTEEDTRKILAWYEKWLGEVPRYVGLLARHRPELLKAYRQRFENTLRLLPKQTEPWSLVQISILRGYKAGIREGMLLARGFGISKNQILEAISWGTFYGGNEALGLVDEVAGDMLDRWPS